MLIHQKARDESRIKSDPAVVGLINEISKVRHGLTVVQHYDTISVPLVYTQVVFTVIIYQLLLTLSKVQVTYCILATGAPALPGKI